MARPFVQYAWIHIVDGKIYEVRPDKEPALMELKRGDDFKSALTNLQIAEWYLAPGQTIPTTGEADIELRRDCEHEPKVGPGLLGASVLVPGEGDEPEVEKIKKIQRRFEVNGWDLHVIISPINAGKSMIFMKPEGAPDNVPFAQPNLKD